MFASVHVPPGPDDLHRVLRAAARLLAALPRRVQLVWRAAPLDLASLQLLARADAPERVVSAVCVGPPPVWWAAWVFFAWQEFSVPPPLASPGASSDDGETFAADFNEDSDVEVGGAESDGRVLRRLLLLAAAGRSGDDLQRRSPASLARDDANAGLEPLFAGAKSDAHQGGVAWGGVCGREAAGCDCECDASGDDVRDDCEPPLPLDGPTSFRRLRFVHRPENDDGAGVLSFFYSHFYEGEENEDACAAGGREEEEKEEENGEEEEGGEEEPEQEEDTQRNNADKKIETNYI